MQGWESIQISNRLPSGEWKHVRCYQKGTGGDCYTVVYDSPATLNGNDYECLSMNGSPNHPTYGICQHSACYIGSHLGKRIFFASLPEACKQAVINDFSNSHN